MFIDLNARKRAPFGGAEWFGVAKLDLISAPPNGAGGVWLLDL